MFLCVSNFKTNGLILSESSRLSFQFGLWLVDSCGSQSKQDLVDFSCSLQSSTIGYMSGFCLLLITNVIN